MIPGIADHPEVFEIDYTQASRALPRSYGDVTHPQPRHPLAHRRHVREAPAARARSCVPSSSREAGGDTLFSNQQAAFDGLSPSLQDFLSDADRGARRPGTSSAASSSYVGEGHWEGKTVHRARAGRAPGRAHAPRDRRQGAVRQPRLHLAHQGARVATRATRCSAFLYEHSVRPEYTSCATTGRPATIGFWDNRATQHAVVGDFGDAAPRDPACDPARRRAPLSPAPTRRDVVSVPATPALPTVTATTVVRLGPLAESGDRPSVSLLGLGGRPQATRCRYSLTAIRCRTRFALLTLADRLTDGSDAGARAAASWVSVGARCSRPA